MTKRSGFTFFLAILFCLPWAAKAAEDRVLATIAEEKVTVGDMDARISLQPRAYQSRIAGTPGTRSRFLQEMVRSKTLARAARDAGMDRDLEIRTRIQMETERILAEAFTDKVYGKVTVSDEEIRRYYDKNKNKKQYEKEFMLPGKVHLLHIAVKSEAEAQQIQAKLNKGADFSQLARKYSIHKAAAQKGGDLGWVKENLIHNFGPAIAKAAKELPSGSVSEPVRYRRAYHIIKVLERKPPSHRPVEDMEVNIRNRLLSKKGQKAMEAVIDELEATLPVRIMDEAGDAGKR